jgi:hypothetical protein
MSSACQVAPDRPEGENSVDLDGSTIGHTNERGLESISEEMKDVVEASTQIFFT